MDPEQNATKPFRSDPEARGGSTEPEPARPRSRLATLGMLA